MSIADDILALGFDTADAYGGRTASYRHALTGTTDAGVSVLLTRVDQSPDSKTAEGTVKSAGLSEDPLEGDEVTFDGESDLWTVDEVQDVRTGLVRLSLVQTAPRR